MNGWVIVYVPGGNIYQMLSPEVSKQPTRIKRLLRKSLSAAFAAAQLYYWVKTSSWG